MVHCSDLSACLPARETVPRARAGPGFCPSLWASQVTLVVQNLPASAGDVKDVGLIPGSGRSLGGGHGNPLQYSCLESPMGRGAWWAMAHRVTKSQTRLSDGARTWLLHSVQALL